MTERDDAHQHRAFGFGVLHGLKLADAGGWEKARILAEKMIEEGRKVLIATRADNEDRNHGPET